MRPESLLLVALAVGAATATYTECNPVTLCIDGLDACGTPWGG
jgi:hypothetical protein